MVSSLLLLIGTGFCRLAVAAPEITRCYLVRWSTLDRVAPDLYIDPNMPKAQKQELQQRVDASKERVSTLYGEYSATPVIIAGQHTMDVMKAYSSNPFNRAGQARISFVATFIILGPDGSRSVDVLSHELAHADISARIGYWRRGKVPNWFDEGGARKGCQQEGTRRRYDDAEA